MTRGKVGKYTFSMSSSQSLSDAAASPQSSRSSSGRRLRRAIFGTAPGRIALIAFAVGVVIWGFWYNAHRTIGWRDTFNPLYWIARYTGNDLYLPEQAMLMHGNRSLHEVALTFDDGPHIESRAQILDTLQHYKARATFFDVGARMTEQSALVRRTLAEGNEIANHSSTHQRLDGLTPRDRHREINDTDVTFYQIAHQHLTLLRPPGERYNDAVLADTRDKGYIMVGHSTAAHDYETDVTPQFIIDRTCASVEDGSIILLHDYPATAQALPQILERLTQQGYHFVTVSQMIAHLPSSPRQAALAFQNQFH